MYTEKLRRHFNLRDWTPIIFSDQNLINLNKKSKEEYHNLPKVAPSYQHTSFPLVKPFLKLPVNSFTFLVTFY